MTILEAKNIDYYFQDGDQRRFILKNVSVSFDKGRLYSILGRSGSGKTTFLSLISALDTPKEGQILFNGKDIAAIGHEKFRRNDISIVFQSYNLIPYLSAVENVLVPMAITENELPKEKKEVAYNLLSYIGITEDKANRQVNQLSGGEQQRVAIARALAMNGDIILADEPTGNLDEELEQEIVDIFKELAHQHQKCVILVTHSSEIARQADEVLELRKGVLSYYE
ncbi:ABC transporter ATP-binding protein [Enterococcus florum]|uniref:ABC transporter ATP-binding protein n=1 Tax=Enterococcus florum TaxID=2480627 RepID=A0A4V0WPZ5_9ENTE|nr:ABC transporter ATP-binding protein [Enterococcus florum]GCF95579.1 ABC transporter ATP-binding protein [Enterococcus florum]